jgi:hypothetical protein
MDIFNVLQNIYEYSNEKVILCDENMKVIWTNDVTLPQTIEIQRFILPAYHKKITLPITEVVSSEYYVSYWNTYGVRITPLPCDDEIVGYLLCFYSINDVAVMTDRSPYRNVQCNYVGNLRLHMTNMLGILDKNKHAFEDAGLTYIDEEMHRQAIQALGSTINGREYMRYNAGIVKTEFMNLGELFVKICDKMRSEISQYFESFEYSCEVEACIYANRDSFGMVLANLATNAAMYNKNEHKKIIIKLEYGTGELEGCGVMTVSDNGDGFTEELLEKVKRPFGCFEDFGDYESLGLVVAQRFCDTFDCELRLGLKTGEYNDVKIIFHKLCEIDQKRLKAEKIAVPYNSYDNISKVLSKTAAKPRKGI